MTYIPTTNTDVYNNLDVVYGGASADAFGRGRVSSPTTLFSTHFQYDLNPLTMQTILTGTGTVVKTTSVASATLSTGGTATSAGAVLESHGYYRYEPGKSQAVAMTGVIGAYTQYVRRKIGLVGNSNGVFFDMDGTTGGANAGGATGSCAVTVRTNTSGSAVDTQVLSPSWNIDKMDGTGPSGITINYAKPQIFFIDLQWLGTGRVRFGFNVGGVLYYCHQAVWANVSSTSLPYMNSATLPLHWEIYNDPAHAAAGTNTMTAVCGSIISEGGEESPQTLIFSADNGITGISCPSSGLTPMISISPALTFASQPNRIVNKILGGSVINTSSSQARWALVYKGTLTAASFNAVNSTYSGMTFDVAATAISGGVIVASGYVQGDVAGGLALLPGMDKLEIPLTTNAADSTADIYTLCGQSTGTTVSLLGQLQWSEAR